MTHPFAFDESVLAAWQRDAVDAWMQARRQDGSIRGVLEVFTGGGKTLMALAAAARMAAEERGLRLAIVVPTEALAHQWAQALHRWMGLSVEQIGLLGAGGSSQLRNHVALVCVLNTAAKKLPELARANDTQPLMLVVDECHRAGAPFFRRVFETPAPYRLGLSATPEREELDQHGEPLAWDEQVLGRELGAVVYRFTLRDARNAGWLPDFTIHHHGVQLTAGERRDYERSSSKVTDLAEQLESLGVTTAQARQAAGLGDYTAKIASAYVAAVASRKDLLYRAQERHRIARAILRKAVDRDKPPRVLLFHERVNEAEALYRALHDDFPERVVLEHSSLPDRQRRQAVDHFRAGSRSVLVSVKSLVEGIDVPDADIGISVASSSSVRQRVQSLGRVLRRTFDGTTKKAEMHVLYVADSVDELIYAKEDWSDLTGADANRYWLWPLEPDEPPDVQPGPPHTPLPTEEMVWEQLGQRVPDEPIRWPGVVPSAEYSVDTRATVRNAAGAVLANPQGVEKMVERVRGRPGGRFRITPIQRLVIVFAQAEDGAVPYVAGQLPEPFAAADTPTESSFDVAMLAPGDAYPGPQDDSGGSFKLRQKAGGVIERKTKHGADFALIDGDSDHHLAARRVLEAWRQLGLAGMPLKINSLGHAWYLDAGQARFLADATPGFEFPGDAA